VNTFTTIVIATAAFAQIAFIVGYATGARWRTNRVGRALMSQAVLLASVLTYVVLRRIFVAPPPMGYGPGWLALGWWSAVSLVSWFFAASFYREMRAWRRRGGSHRSEREKDVT
jgi:hypothetical protein